MKNKRIALLLALLTICVVFLTGCDSIINDEGTNELSDLKAVTNAVANNEGYSSHTNSEGISFSCPTNWISAGEGEMLFFIAPDTTGTSVNLLGEKIGSMISLSGYVEIAKTKLPESMDITSEIQQEEINLNGRKAYVLTYTMKEQDVDMTIKQEVIKVDETVYILTVGTITDYYAEQEETLNNVLSSLTK